MPASELEPLAVVLERASRAADARREQIAQAVAHVHGPQCSSDVCGPTAYEHLREEGPCPVTGLPCVGHMLPSRDELIARTLEAKGLSASG